ncbi:MAG: hypothetical protein SFY81_11805 [Verrucomicrobiota bacterium]|nr:hypothetical protein [Verrucomicrobiota bacterium]
MQFRWLAFSCLLALPWLTVVARGAAPHDPSSQYLLRFKIEPGGPGKTAPGQGAVSNIVCSIEASTMPGKDFFVRVARDERELSLWGKLELTKDGLGFDVRYSVRDAKLGEVTVLPRVFEGAAVVKLSEPGEFVLGSNGESASTCTLSVEHFQPVIARQTTRAHWRIPREGYGKFIAENHSLFK